LDVTTNTAAQTTPTRGSPLTPNALSPLSLSSTGSFSSGSHAAVPASGEAGVKSYTIKSGDTLSSIAVEHYGSERSWAKIAEANPNVDPNRLKIGQVIKLPSGTSQSAATGVSSLSARSATTPAGHPVNGSGVGSSSSGNGYVVKSGDTLSSIARRYYQSPDKWWVIYNANREAIGGDPDHLNAGLSLRIPANP
jgi:nucleoid-associated protein YgaU